MSRENIACAQLACFQVGDTGPRPTPEIQKLLEIFQQEVNDCIDIGLSRDVARLKLLSILSGRHRRNHQYPGYYKICAVSRAVGILAARKKSLRRGCHKEPYSIQPQITALPRLQDQERSASNSNWKTKIPRCSRKTFYFHPIRPGRESQILL